MTLPKKECALRVDIIIRKGTEEILPELLFEQCGGIWIEDLDGETEALIRCYPKQMEPFLKLVRESNLTVKEIKVVKETLQDYAALTRKYFRPITISGVTILAPWQRRKKEGAVIVIDPGMAFGTGRHESTKLMLKMMMKTNLKGRKVLDVGSGSGILSVYAAQNGGRVTAIDRDPIAATAAIHNFALNKMHNFLLACTDLEDVRGRFDVVLANLDYDTISKQYAAIVDRVASHGQLLISGIEEQYSQRLLPLFSAHRLIRRMRMNDWHGFTFQIDNPISV
jgi:ribosomal protein L11 methyltransferase